jgi:hypothetical protein
MKIDKPGIYKDFPEADYFEDPCPAPSLTQSIAKVLIDQSLLHAKEEHPRLATMDEDDEAGEKYDKAKAIGNAAHAVLIGRGKTIAVENFDNWQTKDAKAAKAIAMNMGKVPILAKHMAQAHRMVLQTKLQLAAIAAATKEPALDMVFKEGDGEVVAACEIEGIWLRTLIDWMVNPRLVFDYKSTALSVAPHAVPKLMGDAGWPIQAAMQERILDVLDPLGRGRRRFFFIAQENYKPYALTAHLLPEGTMTMGRKRIAMAETMWREAIKTGAWPGYLPVIHRPELPGWQEKQWLDRELADEAARESGPMLTNMAGG